MSDVRQAALILHGLTTDDREWILSRLVDERVDELRGLLVELKNLGIPADPALIHSAVHRGPAGAGNTAATDITRLASANAEQMRDLLAGEPDHLIALLLSTSAWPWTERFLLLLKTDHAQRIRDLALSLATGPMMRNAIMADISARLPTLPQEGALTKLRARWFDWGQLRRHLRPRWITWAH